jgi:ribosome-binding factor A
MQENPRQNKVAAEIRRILSEYLLRNPIVDFDGIKTSMISITSVAVSGCLRHAKVYIVSLSSDVSNEVSLAFLERHAARLKHHLGNNLQLRFVPDLKFFIDDAYEHTEKIKLLLQNARTANSH